MFISTIIIFTLSVSVAFIDALILLVCSLVADAVIMGRILRYYYETYPAEWAGDGRPQGVVWVAPESRAANGYRRPLLAEKAMEWCLSTPWWMNSEPKMLRLLRYHRWVMLVGAMSLVVIVGVVIALFLD